MYALQYTVCTLYHTGLAASSWLYERIYINSYPTAHNVCDTLYNAYLLSYGLAAVSRLFKLVYMIVYPTRHNVYFTFYKIYMGC